ncbi:hypothetical protein B0J17DRAFT_622414 [Rhizoctonia solani]|nr:hypothetical protein B0J17DRAFT_622414 [Rhizoctonia solani]
MSFRDSISRFKRNLEKKLHIGSGDASPTPSSASLPPVSVYAPLGSSGLSTPGQVALNIPAAPENTDRPSTSTSKTNDHSGTGSVALTGTLHTISDDGNPTSSRMPEVSTDSQPGVVDVPLAVDNTLKTPGGEDNDNQPADHSLAKDNKRDGTTGLVWTGAKLLLQVVNASADVFPPLKSAVGGLNECINIYERAKKGRKDYGHQLNKINELLEELQGYMEGREAMEMTQSVKRVCCELDLEVNNLKAKLEGPAAKQWLKAVDAPAEITECQDRIQRLLERLTLNATMNTLKKLNMQDEKMEKQAAEIKKQGMERRLKEMLPTLSSIYNSAESDDIKRGGCTQGTRQLQIHSLLEWALDPSTGRTCWMNGMAGTGKTTIAYSICSALEERSALGASFFCSRSIPECRQVKHIIPTIAYQLARYSLPFRCALDKVLESNPDARTQALKIQYEKLIVKPLSEVRDSLPTDFIVVIDALDECENESSLGLILDLLISPDFTLPIRFLVSSRPEPEIWERMANSARLVLHELDSSSVETDIERFMKHELRRIPLTDAQWLALLKRCGVLFIFASTACRYIEQENKMGTLDEAVGAVVRSGSGKTQSTDKNSIDELYSTILAAAYQESRMSRENRERMRNVLETVICAGEPMTLSTLVELIGLKNIKQAEALLQPLRSVVNITATTGLVTTLHASFPDYMLSLSRSAGFHCVAPTRHLTLTKACLRTIDLLEPKFNICKLTSSYVSDDKVNNLDDRVKKAISPGLAYACRYWSTHLNLGEHEGQLVEAIDRFFTQRLLVWMEVLNLMKLMRFATSIIRDAEKWCSVS